MERKVIPTSVYAELTPNPNTMKFVADRKIIEGNLSAEFASKAECRPHSPLADDLFNFPFVKGVFVSNNFVTITKNDTIEWDFVTMQLREFVRDFLLENQLAVVSVPEKKEAEKKQSGEITVEPSDYDEEITRLLEEFVRPAVERDGGAIDFKSYKDGKVTVIMKGACSGCPSSTQTLKDGIENLLKSMLPEVKEVVAEEEG